MWFWKAPYWLLATILSCALFLLPKGMRAIEAIISEGGVRTIMPWMAFLAIILLRDGLDSGISSSLTDRVALNAACLMLFIVSAALAYCCDWRHVLILLGIVGLLFGLVAIGQFLGSFEMWMLPDTLSSYSSRNMALENRVFTSEYANLSQEGFERVGRVRGLDLFVHKFSAYQGIIAGMMITMSVLVWQAARRHWGAMAFAAASAIVATLGVTLTFSRAPLFGIVFSLSLVIILTRSLQNRLPLIGMAVFGVVLLLGVLGLELWQADQFGRIFELDMRSGADAGRLVTWLYSLQLFLDNPLIGAGSTAMASAELVTHSVPLRVLGDFGLLGIAPYLLVWWSLFRVALQAMRMSHPDSFVIGLVVLSGLLVAVFDNLTHSSGLLQRDTSQSAILGIGFGLCLGSMRAAHLSAPWVRLQNAGPAREPSPPDTRILR